MQTGLISSIFNLDCCRFFADSPAIFLNQPTSILFMTVSVNKCTWLIGHCEATVEQLVNLFGQPVKLINHTSWSDGKIPYEWRIGFLNITIYPYKFAPEDGRKVYKFSIGGTSSGQVIALQSFLDHVSKSDMWAEHPNCLDCPALGVQVTAHGDYT